MQNLGFEILAAHGFKHYEVSAFAKPGFECKHNLNYWQFGDYLGIGAGAHGKITATTDPLLIQRTAKTRFPKNYLEAVEQSNFNANLRTLSQDDLIFEFMLNNLRLRQGFTMELFEERTGLAFPVLEPIIKKALSKDLLFIQNNRVQTTELGKCFLNDLMGLFLSSQ